MCKLHPTYLKILPALRDVNKYVFVTITTENSTALTNLNVGAHDSDQANSVQNTTNRFSEINTKNN